MNTTKDNISRLEDLLRYKWAKVSAAKNQGDVRRLREEALVVYRELKKTKEFLGIK